MYADEKRVVHDTEALEQDNVLLELFFEKMTLGWAKMELALPVNPIEVFERSARVLCCLFFGVLSAN